MTYKIRSRINPAQEVFVGTNYEHKTTRIKEYNCKLQEVSLQGNIESKTH